MNLQQILICCVAMLVNLTIGGILPSVIYFMIRFPDFTKWIRNAVEDSDEKPHKQDLKDLALLFFACMATWTLLNIIFIAVFTDKDFTALIVTVLGIVATLFGISKLTK